MAGDAGVEVLHPNPKIEASVRALTFYEGRIREKEEFTVEEAERLGLAYVFYDHDADMQFVRDGENAEGGRKKADYAAFSEALVATGKALEAYRQGNRLPLKKYLSQTGQSRIEHSPEGSDSHRFGVNLKKIADLIPGTGAFVKIDYQPAWQKPEFNGLGQPAK
jgi:hypothetical protein